LWRDRKKSARFQAPVELARALIQQHHHAIVNRRSGVLLRWALQAEHPAAGDGTARNMNTVAKLAAMAAE
jgi:uncharacterized protein (DUF1697 family)